MKYTLAVMLLIGAISTSQAIEQQSAGFLQAEIFNEKEAIVNKAAKHTDNAVNKTAQAQQKKKEEPVNKTSNAQQPPPKDKVEKTANVQAHVKNETKPVSVAKLQVESNMEIKENEVVVEPVKKPDAATKAQELAAMEKALKNASEETRK